MYFAFKSLHLIAMVTWFAGLFYMFRLFVYHVENAEKNDCTHMLKTMERKLYYYITWPGMVATILCGFALIHFAGVKFTATWLIIKLSLILALVLYHLYVGYTLKRFKKDDLFLTSKQCRIRNEFPTLILVAVIVVAVYRHFF